ncbi:hypothetical protein ACP4OV_024255 [Aristida adscensionis]
MDESISQNKNGKTGDSLEEIILSWTVSSISNEQPVRAIPGTFDSISEYADSFRDPLVEETRCQIKASLCSIHRSHYYRLRGVSEGNRSKYFLDIDTSCKDDVRFVAQNGDLFLLSTHEPKDKSFDSGSGVFALAVDIPPNEYICKSFHVVASSDLSSREYCSAIFFV